MIADNVINQALLSISVGHKTNSSVDNSNRKGGDVGYLDTVYCTKTAESMNTTSLKV